MFTQRRVLGSGGSAQATGAWLQDSGFAIGAFFHLPRPRAGTARLPNSLAFLFPQVIINLFTFRLHRAQVPDKNKVPVEKRRSGKCNPPGDSRVKRQTGLNYTDKMLPQSQCPSAEHLTLPGPTIQTQDALGQQWEEQGEPSLIAVQK